MDALRATTDEFVENQMTSGTTLTEEQKAFLRTILEKWEGLAATTASTVASAASVASSPSAADRRLQALYTAEWQWRQLQLPDTDDTQKPVQDHLPRVDAAAQAERLNYWQDVLQELQNIPRTELSAPEQQNYDVYRPQIEALVSSQKFREFEMPANSDTTCSTSRVR